MTDISLTIDDALAKDLETIAEGRPLSEMVTAALQEYIKRQKKERLFAMFGKVEYYEEYENPELQEAHGVPC